MANFIRTRDTPGSYHELVDSDTIIDMIRWTCEAFHDGTGTNPHSMGLSFACRTVDWKAMSSARRDAFIEHGAQAAARYADWVKVKYGIVIPATRLTREESTNRKPGFVSHGQRDPGRRTDPGDDFPWSDFLARYSRLVNGTPQPTPPIPEPKRRRIALAYP